MSKPKLRLLDSVLIEPAEALGEVPAQRHGQDVDQAEQSEGVEQHGRVRQEGQSCEDRNTELKTHVQSQPQRRRNVRHLLL